MTSWKPSTAMALASESKGMASLLPLIWPNAVKASQPTKHWDLTAQISGLTEHHWELTSKVHNTEQNQKINRWDQAPWASKRPNENSRTYKRHIYSWNQKALPRSCIQTLCLAGCLWRYNTAENNRDRESDNVYQIQGGPRSSKLV